MRLALLLLLATSASAQTPGSWFSNDHPAARVLAGTTVSLGLPVAVFLIGPGDVNGAVIAGIVAIPLTAALGAHYLGTDGSGDFRRTFAGAGIGALAGGAVLGTGILLTCGGESMTCLQAYAIGALALFTGPAIGAGLMYRSGTVRRRYPDRSASAVPVMLSGPGGERVAGVALRIGL